MESHELNISWGALWKVLLMAALVAVLYVSRDVLLAALLAITIASALEPFVSYLERKRIPRIIGTLAIYLLSILAIALIIYIVIPIFLVELNSILTNSNDLVGSISTSLGVNPSLFETLTATINTFTATLLGGKTTLVAILSQLLGGLLLMIIVFVISFYLTIDKGGLERFITTILPRSYHDTVLQIYERMRHKISNWFAGQIFLSIVIGIAVWLGLWALGVKYSFIIGIVAAVLELVPYVGPIFSGSLAVITAMTQSTSLGMYTLILFIAIQQVESHFLIPAVNKYTTNLNPVIVIMALLIGGKVFGIVGIILAVPIAVLFQEILKNWSNARTNETPTIRLDA